MARWRIKLCAGKHLNFSPSLSIQCILGEKLRGNHLSERALSHPGRFKVAAGNLKMKQD